MRGTWEIRYTVEVHPVLGRPLTDAEVERIQAKAAGR